MNTLNSYIRLLLVAIFLIPGTASAIEGQLLGLTRDNPLIDSSVDTALTCSYDGTTLLVQSQADFIEFTAGGNTALIFSDMTGTMTGGLFEISAQIDNTGTLLGGTFTVTGAYVEGVVKGDPNPILTGDIVDFGIRDNGNTDPADFKIANLSGDLTTSPDWPAGAIDGAVNLTLLNSLYAGSATATGFNVPWGCAGANGNAGPTPSVQEGCNLSIIKTASTPTIGPPAPKWDGDDSDSDSGRDHDGSGDSDDSDSDSEASSADSDGGPADCGCKGRVTQLTMRWNALTPSTVQVVRKNGMVLFPATLVQPGEEFSFAVKGGKIKFIADGEVVKTLKTKCKNPIGPGQEIGNFVVVSGQSKWPATIPLCPFPGTTCGSEFEVTYTYEITNSGPGNANNVIVYDDQLGVIDSFASNPSLVSIPANGSVTVLTTVCVFETTTNIATAFADSASGEACTFTDGGNTATVVEIPAPCDPGDSDSDSGSDNNASGDSDDDSDSDSSPGDCDGDGT